MIACPYCGKENSGIATNCKICGTLLPRPSDAAPAIATPPELPKPVSINPDALEGFFSFEDGFHRANWPKIFDWIDAHVSPIDAEAACSEAALMWVTKLREDLGGNYFILQSKRTIFLSAQPLERARSLLNYANRIADTLERQLGRVAWGGARCRDVILMFSDEDDYYQYVVFHCPDGEQPTSGGVCIHSGYTHIAIPWKNHVESAANTIVHELSHDCVAHLPIPLWLNEGLAVTFQKSIAPLEHSITTSDHTKLSSAFMDWRPPLMWDELAERHFAFWTEENIQTFWAGTSFFIPGESNELSYSLAEVFVKLLTERCTVDAFQTLLLSAQSGDAGQTAMLDILDTDLGDLAATFLGEGNWRPVRKAMVQCWEAAGWNKNESTDRAE